MNRIVHAMGYILLSLGTSVGTVTLIEPGFNLVLSVLAGAIVSVGAIIIVEANQ